MTASAAGLAGSSPVLAVPAARRPAAGRQGGLPGSVPAFGDAAPQLRQREMYRESEHPALGPYKVQNAPFKLSETPAANHLPSPMIGEHTREIVEGLLGLTHEELCAGFTDGTFWPTRRPRFPYQEEMLR